jgi:protein-S-isoprenylcysteine O-methyltransferase Ste14
MYLSPRVRGYLWVGSQFALLATWFALMVLGRRFYPPNPIRYYFESAGYGIALAGIILALLGVYEMRENLRTTPEPGDFFDFVTTRIYSRVRHPIYGGIMLLIVGVTMIFTALDAAILAAVLIAFFYAKSRYEESRLRGRIGDYDQYSARTKRFIPFVW